MGAYKLIIGCNFEQYDAVGGDFIPNRYLILDKIDDRQITASATIASQPMQSGDTISDHMYRNPDEFTVSGTFSLNGMNWNDNSYDFIQQGDRLTNIQHAFEKIKDEGILCTLITLDSDALQRNETTGQYTLDNEKIVNASTRFKIRKNMALKSITWTEMQNSVKYSFTFYQVIMVEAQEYVNLTEDMKRELGLPSVNNPYGSTLGTVLSETGALYQSVIQTLYDKGYFDEDFLNKAIAEEVLADFGHIGLIVANTLVVIGAVVATAAVVGVITGILGASAVSAAIFPVGTIIAAVAAIGVAIFCGVKAMIDKHEQEEKKKKMFKLVNGSAFQDANRLINLLYDIEAQVNQIQSNVTVYSIQENKPQQLMMNIAGNYYVIEFSENNTNGYGWEAKVTDNQGQPLTTVLHNKWCPVSSFTDMNRNLNCWFRDSTKQYEVYLMNPALSADYNPSANEVAAVRNHLSSYTIWVSKGNIEDNITVIQDAIMNAIENQGFE